MAISAVNNGQQTTVATTKPAFKGSYKRTEQGNPYYHTNSAMKIGGTLAGISTLGLGLDLAVMNKMDEFTKMLPKNQDFVAKSKAAIIAGGIISILGHLGSAAYIDSKRNQKVKEVANYTKQVGTKNAITERDDIGISYNNRPYYESNVGAKTGGWLGAGLGAITYTKEFLAGNKALKGASGIFGAAVGTGLFTLGGWLLGKWSDSIANNDARKHA